MGVDGGSSFGVLHRRQGIIWGIWLLLTPAIIRAARASPFGSGTQWWWWVRQILVGISFALASAAIIALLRALNSTFTAILGAATPATLVSYFAGDLLRFAIVSLAYQAFAYHGVSRAREAEAAKFRADLAEARLAGIEGKLHPHFLFNTLNAIAALVREDPAAAETMVEQLSGLLRASLASSAVREVPLDEELRLTEQYLAIQQVRFQDRLTTTVDASGAARKGRVPQFILQPLVENAVRHGICSRETGGTVRVTATVEHDTLVMAVEDDGVGMGNAPSAGAGSGVGLGSVRSRLTHLYGANQHFESVAVHPSGTRMIIRLPYRTTDT